MHAYHIVKPKPPNTTSHLFIYVNSWNRNSQSLYSCQSWTEVKMMKTFSLLAEDHRIKLSSPRSIRIRKQQKDSSIHLQSNSDPPDPKPIWQKSSKSRTPKTFQFSEKTAAMHSWIPCPSSSQVLWIFHFTHLPLYVWYLTVSLDLWIKSSYKMRKLWFMNR